MPAPRRWIKLFCYERLHGSVTDQLTESEQSVWDKLLCLAGLCGHEGLIADHDRRPYSSAFIIHELHTANTVYYSTLKKCLDEGRIKQTDEGLVITNWARYQSEYDRQKPYRQKSRDDDPDKYTRGKYGHLVHTGLEGTEYDPRLKGKGKGGQSENSESQA